jgi:hypothetical protein
MYSARNLTFISIGVIIVLFLISLYYGIISPPPLITYTTDENFIGESGIFLLYGNTPRALEWAALPSTFIAYLLFIAWCGISVISQFSGVHGFTDILTLIDKNTFYYLNHREEFIIWERLVQFTLIAFIIYKTIQVIIQSKSKALNNNTKLFLYILCLCTNVIWLSTQLIRPEALAGSLFLYIIVNILFSETITPKFATTLLILFILTFTQRLIYLFLSPFVIVSLLNHLRKYQIQWKTYFNYFGVVCLAFFALMPFIITDTLVVMKSFLGGLVTKVNHDPMATYFNMGYINEFIAKPINIFFTIVALLGMWFLVKTHNSKIIAVFFIGNFLFYTFSSLKAAQLYPSHTFPLAVMAIVFIAFGLGNTIALNSKWKFWVVLLLFLGTTTYDIYQNNKELTQQQQNLADTVNWVKTLPRDEKILCELSFDGLLPKNQTCLLREYEANASDGYRMNKLQKLLKLPAIDSISKFKLPVVAQSFAFEDEKLFDTQYQVLIEYLNSDKVNRYDTDYFFVTNSNMSHCLVKEEAIQKFQAGKYHYLITKEKIAQYNAIKSFEKGGGDSFWVYEYKNL